MRKFKYFTSLVLVFAFLYAPAIAQTTFYVNGASVYLNNGASVYVAGDVTIQTGGTIDNSGLLELTRDWTNNSGSTALVNGSPGWVVMLGDTQLIGGNDVTSFSKLRLAGTGAKMLANDVNVDDTLDLTDRQFVGDSFQIYVNNTDTSAVQFTSGFVSNLGSGRLNRDMNSIDKYQFPVGSNVGTARIRQVDITPRTTNAHTYGVRFVNNDPTSDLYDRAVNDSSFLSLNDEFYHMIDQVAGSDPADVTIAFDSTTDGAFDGIAHWQNLPRWENATPTTVNYSSGMSEATVAAWNDFTFGPFDLGFVDQSVSRIDDIVGAITIYPNPATEAFTIDMELPMQSDVLIALYDMKGNVVMRKSRTAFTSGSINFETDGISAGTYTVKVSSAKGVAVRQLIIGK